MPLPLKVLIAEDNPADAELVLRELRRAGFAPDWQRVETEADYLARLPAGYDLVLSDFQMPQFNGLRALELLKQSGLEIPFILVSGTIGEDTAVEAMRQGASDYLLKDRLTRLGAAVTHALAQSQLLRERRQADEKLRSAHAQLGQANQALSVEINERKRSEEALRQSEEHYRYLFDNMLNGYASCRMIFQGGVAEDFTYLSVNRAFVTLTGLKDVAGKNVSTVIPGFREIDPELFASYGRVTLTGVPERFEKYVRSTNMWLSISIYRPQAGHFVAMFDVITDRKLAEAALNQSEERYRLLFDHNPLPMWLYDLETLRFLAVNESAIQQYGYSREEFLGMTLKQIHLPEDMVAMLKSLESGRTEVKKTSEWRHRRKDGSIIHVEVSARPLQLDGRTVRLVLAADITGKKLLEAQFFRAQRLESIGTLASGIAHDLNNILAPIMMAAPIVRISKSPAVIEKMLATIESSAQRAAKLVRQLLTFGRGVEGEKDRLSVAAIIKEMLTIAQQTFPKNITIAVEIAEDVSPIMGDATQVHQVLLNLCVNARDAMPHGGTLTIGAANVQFDLNSATMMPGAKAGDYVLVSVADTGTGMTPEIIDKIFDPFFTTKGTGKGTGLGLATVLGLVKSHGGFLNLSSVPGKGSTFLVYFPAMPKMETVELVVPTAPPPPGHGELVLVIDDEENIRDTVGRTLTEHGYAVAVAKDGIEGTAHYAMALNEIKLVITDLDMPNMDGVNMIRVLKQMNPKLKVVASSGVLSQKFMGARTAELTTLGVTAYLSKPYTADQVLRTVHQALVG